MTLALRPVFDAVPVEPISPGIPFHPLANLFPLIEGPELNDLVESVSARGLNKPIVLHQGKILDGRNRYRAAIAAQVEPRFTLFGWPEGWPCPLTVIDAALAGRPMSRAACRALPAPMRDSDGSFTVEGLDGDALAFVLDENLTRRHLDETQRAMLAARLVTVRQGERTDLSPIGEKSGRDVALKVSQAQAAELMKIGKRSVERAAKVLEKGTPELVDAVDRGQLKVYAAEKIAEQPVEEQRETVTRVLGVLKERKSHVWARAENEWYVEPRLCTRALLKAERFNGPVWDPSCGQGNIVSECIEAGLEAYGTDIVDRNALGGTPDWFKGLHDFLKDDLDFAPKFDVINNPPYSRAEGTEAFARKALAIATGKVAIFTEMRFLGSKSRAEGLFREFPPTRVWICLPRPSCPPGEYLLAGNKAGNGQADWCWIVWDRSAPKGPPQLGWLVMDEDDDE